MALTLSAALVDDGTGWDNTPPAGHAGWNNPAGDDVWVPDRWYNRRVLLELTTDTPGELANGIVNWEIYGNDLDFVTDAATENTVDAPMVNNLATRTIWTRNATPWGAGDAAPYYEESGTPWVSTLRATQTRVVIEFPFYAAWAAEDTESSEFLVEAYLPGAFGTPSAQAQIVLSNPDEAKFG